MASRRRSAIVVCGDAHGDRIAAEQALVQQLDRRRPRRSPARSAGAPVPAAAGRCRRRSRRAAGCGHESPRGRRPVLWLDWMSLRVIRNSTRKDRLRQLLGRDGMATIVLAHGAWSAAWAWKKMRPLFAAAGHEFFSPTYTGLGERAHLAHHEIDLTTHINDVAAVLEFEDLKDVTLLGHSYGGMVATGVADKARRPHRTRRLYRRLRAQGRPEPVRPRRTARPSREHARQGDGRRRRRLAHPAQSRCRPTPRPRTSAWATPRRRSQPIKTFEQKITARVARAAAAARLHLRQAQRTGRHVPPVRRPRQERSRAGNTTRWTPATIRTSPARRT